MLFCMNPPDVTAVCILEAFQNQQSMLLADKVLKQLGKEKAKEKYKVFVQIQKLYSLNYLPELSSENPLNPFSAEP